MRKTALLSGVAGLFLMTAPAFAQDSTAPQTPPTTPPAATPPMATPPTAQAPTLSLQPGATVRGADGELGVLVGARTEAGSQQLTVQGADGQVRAVPINGIRQEGDAVVVDFTLEQFNAAETIAASPVPAAPTTPPVPATPAMPAPEEADDDATEADEATPPVPAAPVQPGVTDPATPPGQSPPTLPPETPASPPPGEGQGDEPDA